MGSRAAVLCQWCVSPRGQRWLHIGLYVAIAVLALPAMAFAEETGFERFAFKIVDLLTGNLAILASIIGVAYCGFQLLFSGHHDSRGGMIACIAGIVLINGAAQFASWVR